jgi:hypothetical protein
MSSSRLSNGSTGSTTYGSAVLVEISHPAEFEANYYDAINAAGMQTTESL